MTIALEILKWWFIAACVVLPFALALMRANGPDREPAPKPVLVWVNERKVEGR